MAATFGQFPANFRFSGALPPRASVIVNPAGNLPKEATGAAAIPSPALSPLEELNVPSRDQRSPSIQDSTAMDSLQLLSVDEAGLVGEGCQDD